MSNRTNRFPIRHGLLLVEGAALIIARVMPVTPFKTGSGRGPADLLIPDPGCFQEVLVYFILANILILIIGLGLWLGLKLG